jgi:hypothetical protein
MKLNVSRFTLAALLIFAAAVTTTAQDPPSAKPMIPLKIQVVIARYEGDKKISSLPYTLSVTANASNAVSLRMGSQVPVPSSTPSTQPNQGPTQTFTYLTVGTSIDSSAGTTDDGRFRVSVSIEDTSIQERTPLLPVPTLRTFSIANAMTLRDGQTAQFTSAADKTTGEVVKVDVTLTVEK